MSKRNIDLDHLSNIKVRNDGDAAPITFTGKSEQDLTVTLLAKQLPELFQKLLEVMTVSAVNRSTISDNPQKFSPLRDVLLVETFQMELPPDGSLSFLLTGRDDRFLQVTFHDQHAQALAQALWNIQQKHQRP